MWLRYEVDVVIHGGQLLPIHTEYVGSSMISHVLNTYDYKHYFFRHSFIIFKKKKHPQNQKNVFNFKTDLSLLILQLASRQLPRKL